MNLDPTKLHDWEIAEKAEENIKNIKDIAKGLDLNEDEIILHGNYVAKIDFIKVLKGKKKKGKFISVTAITPTPFGEGKTTTTIGLLDGLCSLNKKATAAIRQPSAGPTFNLKGSGAGGGLAQCIPLSEMSLKLTGDIDSITNAHNLSMVALTARMQHEKNSSDERLKANDLTRLNIDETNIEKKWAIDFCAQVLRNITIGQGGKFDGVEMDSGFYISAASELMAILSIAKDLPDLRKRLANITMGYSKEGSPIYAKDLEVDGAMCAWLVSALKPNLMQTIEKNPVIVHGGPFANISIGQSSIIADEIGLALSEYHITESGFASEIGYEKFWNIKCRLSGHRPDCAVIVTTIRALKMHGGGEEVKKGEPLSKCYLEEDLSLVEKGLANLLAHIEVVRKSGVTPVVCLNHFKTDTENEINLIRKFSEENKALFAVSKHWLEGGKGAKELAEVVIKACEMKNDFKFLYDEKDTIQEKILKIATNIYGAKNVVYSDLAEKKLKEIENIEDITKFNICIAKTPLSLSDDPKLKGRPEDWDLKIDDILLQTGAEMIVPVAGKINLMPGTVINPKYRNIDVDLDTGKITGIF